MDLYLLRRLPPLEANVGKRLVKSPKLYLRDSGLVHALLGLRTLEDLLAHPVVGRSYEGFVVENLLRVLPEGGRGLLLPHPGRGGGGPGPPPARGEALGRGGQAEP